MRKLWLILKQEYLRMVGKRSFLWGTLGIPVLLVVVMAFSIYMSVGKRDNRPLGYVDQSGLLAAAIPGTVQDKKTTELRAFETQETAQAASEAGEIQGFYVIPADYLQSRQVELYYWDKSPGEAARSDFRTFLRTNLAASLPAEARQRVLQGTDLTVRALSSKREFNEREFINLILPFAVGFFLYFAIMTSSGYMLQAVADEKENRTIEILATSVSPEELIGGKALGTMAVSLTQLLIWGLTVIVGLIIGAQFLEPLRAAKMPWSFLGITALYFVPAYALVVGMMTIIGVSVSEVRQGQQISGIVSLLFTAPFFFIALIFANPNNPILVALTLFPTTTFLTVVLRWAFSDVPLWQMLTGWALLVATALASIWVAARVFRREMLNYGQRFDLRGVLQAVRIGKQ